MKAIVLGLLVLAGAASSVADGPAWKAEPSAVFGIPIGGALDAASLRDCGGIMNSTGEESISACALKRPTFGDGPYVIGGFPVREFTEGAITLKDGVVESVLLKSKFADYQQVKSLLIERYGKPSKEISTVFETNGGKAVKSRVSMWVGRTVSITFAERSGMIDTSSTSFATTSSIKAMDGEANRNRKSDASKM